MSIDLLEKLAELPVPPAPPPQTFDRAVHQRINSRLIVGQMSDFVLRGSAFGIAHFAKATLGLLRFSFTGKFPEQKNDKDRPSV